MNKKICFLLLFLLLVCTAGACQISATSGDTGDSLKRVFTYAENHAEDYPTTMGAYRFSELVYERTEGRIEIQVNAAGILGDEKEVIEQLQYGGIDFSRVSLSPLAEFVPALNTLQMPYLYTGQEHMWKVLDGEIGNGFLNSLENSKLVGLSWYDAGARSFYNRVRPINCLEDMNGLNIRVQESSLMADMVEALGANPVQMAFNEVYSQLEMGTIDGAENNWPSYEGMKHYQVARYYTIDEHTRVPELQLCSRSTWESLSAADQELIRACAMESALYQRTLWTERERRSEQLVRAAGCEIIELSETEKERFRKAVWPVYQDVCEENMDIIEAIIEAGK